MKCQLSDDVRMALASATSFSVAVPPYSVPLFCSDLVHCSASGQEMVTKFTDYPLTEANWIKYHNRLFRDVEGGKYNAGGHSVILRSGGLMYDAV